MRGNSILICLWAVFTPRGESCGTHLVLPHQPVNGNAEKIEELFLVASLDEPCCQWSYQDHLANASAEKMAELFSPSSSTAYGECRGTQNRWSYSFMLRRCGNSLQSAQSLMPRTLRNSSPPLDRFALLYKRRMCWTSPQYLGNISLIQAVYVRMIHYYTPSSFL